MMTAVLVAIPDDPRMLPLGGKRVKVTDDGTEPHPDSGEFRMDIWDIDTNKPLGAVWDSELKDWQEVEI